MTATPSVEERSYAPGDVIFQAGEPCDTVFIVKEGEVSVDIRYRGRLLTIACTEGDVLGDAGFVFERANAPTKPGYGGAATAVTPVTLLLLPRGRLDDALAETPVLIRAWIASFVTRSMKVIDALSD